jgi:hypothetical protein
VGLEIGTIVAIAAATTAVAGVVTGQEARRDARRAQEKSASEQRASNAANAALERRKQIREERVRRARILQSGENSGTAGSSSEAGAVGGLSTTLSSNVGFNLGEIMRSQNISLFQQDYANAQANQATGNDLFNLGSSIFQASGGFSNFKKPPTDNVAKYLQFGETD